MAAETSAWIGIVQALIAAGAGLTGVLAGSYMTARNQSAERRNIRIREQLSEFYSPMLGVRTEILSKAHVRAKIRGSAGPAWQENLDRFTDSAQRKNAEEPPLVLNESLDYDTSQLRDEIIPLYGQMLDHFTSHMWLAERSTQKHYDTLCEFVEVWNRSLEQSLPSDAVTRMQRNERTLYPFYIDLQDNFDRLVEELKK